MAERRFQRRIEDIRDRMNAQLNRLLNEEPSSEGTSLVERFSMFRREEGGGPQRRRRERANRIRQVTFKVSVFRTHSINIYRSHRDVTPACRVVVNEDLDSQAFVEALRHNLPNLPENFQLCRVNGQRQVVALQETCPRRIRQTNELGRSNLYILPKISAASEEGIQLPGIPEATDHGRGSEEENTEPEIILPTSPGQQNHDNADRQPQESINNFYIDSESSHSEDVDIDAESEDSNHEDEKELGDLILDFQNQNINSDITFPMVARRRHILKSACVALKKSYFDWKKVPLVTFVGEMADDYGGPRREFLRLLMIEITTSLGIFEGQQGNLHFHYNLQSLEQQKYYTAGKLMAWSIIHNGPGPRCLQRELFHMMCGERPDLTHVDVDLLLDPELSANMEKLNSCRTPEALATMKEGIGDWIAACGVPEVFSATLDDLPRLKQQIVAHFLFHRVASVIQQFVAGADSCGQFWQVVKRFWRQFLPVFTNTGGKLSKNCIQNLFTTVWSDPGSNRRDMEEDTIVQWEWWLIGIQEGEVDITYEELLVFTTGADSIPPLGFQQPVLIEFYDQEPGTRRIPYASTCSLTLFLPRGVGEEEDFKELMNTAIKGSLGFGKV